MSAEYDHLFKFVLIGDSGVGKSCLILRFCDDTYTESFISTIGVDFKLRTIEVNQKIIKLQIWDTCARPYFRNTNTNVPFRGAHGIIVVFDVTDQASFSNVKQWFQEIDRYACENVNRILVGCKCDLVTKTVVNYATAQNFVDLYGLQYFECSSKYGINVNDMFSAFALEVYTRVVEPVKTQQSATLKVKRKEKERGCARKIQ